MRRVVLSDADHGSIVAILLGRKKSHLKKQDKCAKRGQNGDAAYHGREADALHRLIGEMQKAETF